jgi:predicted RNA-binding Zn ribbon-like protein
VADRQTATGEIGLVQAFVNTVDLQDGPEELSDPNTLKAWLVASGLLDGTHAVDASDLKHATALREAIRSVIGANSGSKVYPVDIATLNEAAGASGLVAAMGRIVAAMYAAMEDENWTRLKLCTSQTCRWAFYDRSKNHSSRWCTMASCGNREKARRFRTQSKTR